MVSGCAGLMVRLSLLRSVVPYVVPFEWLLIENVVVTLWLTCGLHLRALTLPRTLRSP